jgi:DNA-directed RNA polymerase subunit RPC12/RpoP
MPNLFGGLPRAPRILRMHVIDAGEGVAKFRCARCGYSSGWVSVRTVTEGKRGIPCPRCNRDAADV